jgi:hypothetical protein
LRCGFAATTEEQFSAKIVTNPLYKSRPPNAVAPLKRISHAKVVSGGVFDIASLTNA